MLHVRVINEDGVDQISVLGALLFTRLLDVIGCYESYLGTIGYVLSRLPILYPYPQTRQWYVTL